MNLELVLRRFGTQSLRFGSPLCCQLSNSNGFKDESFIIAYFIKHKRKSSDSHTIFNFFLEFVSTPLCYAEAGPVLIDAFDGDNWSFILEWLAKY